MATERIRTTAERKARIQRLLMAMEAAMAEVEDAQRAAQAQDDNDPGEGRGTFGWAILSTLIAIGAAIGAYSAHVLR